MNALHIAEWLDCFRQRRLQRSLNILARHNLQKPTKGTSPFYNTSSSSRDDLTLNMRVIPCKLALSLIRPATRAENRHLREECDDTIRRRFYIVYISGRLISFSSMLQSWSGL